jgi:hypothetical protein
VGTGLTGEEYRSDRCVTTQSEIFEAEDTRRDLRACVEAKQFAVTGHLSDGESLKTSKTALEGLVLTVYFGTPSMFITLWFGFDYGTNPPLGTLII